MKEECMESVETYLLKKPVYEFQHKEPIVDLDTKIVHHPERQNQQRVSFY